ncbi:MAG: class flavin-dependent oxidoreductase [Aeromicrobium sp.]|nr:class flavin-dependent oxidoreductase [Aeromicrobium sp.]
MMKLSCAFGPSSNTVEHIAAAEAIGYHRAWVYDSPAVYLDPWVTLALASVKTTSIQLGASVVTPSLRHPMALAAAIAALEDVAPGRISVGFGAGASSRWLLGKRPVPWADVEKYIVTIRGLLNGDTVEWEGRPIRMVHPEGWGPSRPIRTPIIVGAEGPKGMDVARRTGDGVTTFVQTAPTDFDWVMRLVFGTVLRDGESPESDRVYAATGAIAGLGYHATYEWSGQAAVKELPNGEMWLQAALKVPEEERHLSIHDGHGVVVNDLDRDTVPREMLALSTWVGSSAEIAERIQHVVSEGVTEVTYQPGGPAVVDELESFAHAAKLLT